MPAQPFSTAAAASDIHRTFPHSLEAEQGILGSMIIAASEVIPIVVEGGASGKWFYTPAHETVFDTLVEMWTKEDPADLITMTQLLRDRKQLEAVGGPAYLSSLIDFTPTAANASYYLEIVKEKFVLRQMILVGTEMVSKAYDDTGEVYTLLDDSETKLLAIRESSEPTKGDVFVGEHVMGAIENIEKLYSAKGEITGLSTGMVGFDRLTGGLEGAHMYVIAARPSMGKTAWAMNVAEHVAVTLKKPVGIFSLEMSAMQLVQRMLLSRARVSAQKLRDGVIKEYDFPNLTKAASAIAESKMMIDDTSGISIAALRAKSRRWKKEHGIELIVVDYLQLCRSDTKRAQNDRQLEIAEISAGLKALSKELNIPVIVLAQLNRKPEDRAGGTPRLSDLRESGAIEQDADLVGLLHRGEYYANDEEEKEDLKGEAKLIIAKQRNGPVDDVLLTFLKDFARFEDRAPQAENQ